MSSASGVETVHRFTKAARLTVHGQAHLVDFSGDTSVAHDPDVLRRYLAGEVATLPLLVRADSCDGVGATVGEVTWVMDPDLLPGITLRNTDASGPVILRNSNAMTFPPENDAYELVQPIGLEDVRDPGPVLATIDSFPTIVNPVVNPVG